MTYLESAFQIIIYQVSKEGRKEIKEKLEKDREERRERKERRKGGRSSVA